MSTENRPRTTAEDLTLTVGQTSGHLCGSDEKPIQAALDYLRRLGGGCVNVGPGVYDFRAPLMMAPSVKLVGTGGATVLRKMPSHRTPVIRDADWYEARIDVEDPSGFEPGDGIMMQATPKHGKRTVVKRIVTAVEGQSIHLSDRLMDNLWLDDDAYASTLFPLITADELTHDVTVEDLVLDGNRDENDEINGNYAGGVFIQRCDRWQFNRVTSRNYNGDGFSFQVCDDVAFHECTSLNNANLGFHPGSGSQRPRFIDCVSRANGQGIFFCWGVSDGRAEDCTLVDNRDYGVSIGHRDTDNELVGCTIEDNHKVGILFREQTDFRSGHRTTVRDCMIRDNGFATDGNGVDVRGPVGDLLFEGNTFEDRGQGRQKIGIQLGPEAGDPTLRANTFIGLEAEINDSKERKGEPVT